MDVAFWILVGGLLMYTWLRIAKLAWDADEREKVKRKFDTIMKNWTGGEND